MTQPKPILVLKQKCKECKGDGNTNIHRSHYKFTNDEFRAKELECCPDLCDCNVCKGTGQQEIKIYTLKDFKICKFFICVEGRVLAKYGRGVIPHNKCKGTGYKIPFKDYEIKKVSEITEEEAKLILIEIKKLSEPFIFIGKEPTINRIVEYWFKEKHNLKEDDKVVII